MASPDGVFLMFIPPGPNAKHLKEEELVTSRVREGRVRVGLEASLAARLLALPDLRTDSWFLVHAAGGHPPAGHLHPPGGEGPPYVQSGASESGSTPPPTTWAWWFSRGTCSMR